MPAAAATNSRGNNQFTHFVRNLTSKMRLKSQIMLLLMMIATIHSGPVYSDGSACVDCDSIVVSQIDPALCGVGLKCHPFQIETPYKQDTKHGIQKQFNSKGNTLKITPYSHGEIDGDQIEYYESGIIRSIITYKLGKEDGASKWFYENGELQMEITGSTVILMGHPETGTAECRLLG
jgi:hypothetical protein